MRGSEAGEIRSIGRGTARNGQVTGQRRARAAQRASIAFKRNARLRGLPCRCSVVRRMARWPRVRCRRLCVRMLMRRAFAVIVPCRTSRLDRLGNGTRVLPVIRAASQHARRRKPFEGQRNQQQESQQKSPCGSFHRTFIAQPCGRDRTCAVRTARRLARGSAVAGSPHRPSHGRARNSGNAKQDPVGHGGPELLPGPLDQTAFKTALTTNNSKVQFESLEFPRPQPPSLRLSLRRDQLSKYNIETTLAEPLESGLVRRGCRERCCFVAVQISVL